MGRQKSLLKRRLCPIHGGALGDRIRVAGPNRLLWTALETTSLLKEPSACMFFDARFRLAHSVLC